MSTTYTTSGEPRTTTRVGPRASSGRVFWNPTDVDDDVAEDGGDMLLEVLLHELRHLNEFLKQGRPPEGQGSGEKGKVGEYDRVGPDPSQDHTSPVPDSGIRDTNDAKKTGSDEWRKADKRERELTQKNKREAEAKMKKVK